MTNYDKYFGTPDKVVKFLSALIPVCSRYPACDDCPLYGHCDDDETLEWLQEECDADS